MNEHAERWNIGTVAMAEIFDALAERSGMTRARVEAHARWCCAHLVFNETALRVATERRLPQALVTVNPDLFAELIAPAYELTSEFDVIVMSFAEQTNDKTALCDTALTRLGFDGPRSEALLIDNRLDLVNAWRNDGGTGYVFESDEQFAADLPSLLSSTYIPVTPA